MFDFAPVGIGVALAGLAFISLFGWRLTPKREAQSSPDELFEIENYITEVIIPEGSRFVGQTIFHLTSAMEKETEATVVSLTRGEIHKPAPSWYEILEPGDVLMVEAAPDDIKSLMDGLGLELAGYPADGSGHHHGIHAAGQNIGRALSSPALRGQPAGHRPPRAAHYAAPGPDKIHDRGYPFVPGHGRVFADRGQKV
jgi:hypothetical protein